MKNYKLFKSLVMSAPVLVTPLVANSCSSNNNKTPSAKYYVDALAKTLKTQLNLISSQVTSTAIGNNSLDISSNINTAIIAAKKIAPKTPSNIDKITLSFTGTNNLKVEKNSDNQYLLMVYPTFISNDSAKQNLTTTLSLTLSASDKNTQTITNTYDVAKGFKAYDTGPGAYAVNSVYPIDNGNTIFAGTAGEGVSVGTKTGTTYSFQNLKTGLDSNYIWSVHASSDGNTLYVGTGDPESKKGGVSVGTKQEDNSYTFQNYTSSLNNDYVNSVYPSNDGSFLYVATDGGVAVGTKNDSTYNFQTYTKGLGSSSVYFVYPSSDGNKLYTATNGGLSIGTKNPRGNEYTFKNFSTEQGLPSNIVYSVYPTNNGNTIYAGTTEGVVVGTKASGSEEYTFKTYTTGLGSKRVNSVYPTNNGNTIYAGTGGDKNSMGGVSVGTKQTDGSYTFQNYTAGSDVNSVASVYPTNNGNTIYAGAGSGLWVSQSNWFSQKTFNFLTNVDQTVTLNHWNTN